MQRIAGHPRVRGVFALVSFALLLAGDAVRLSLGWWVFGVAAVLMGLVAGWLIVALRDRWRFDDLPYPLVVFIALAVASLAWSAYPAATALGLFTTLLATVVALALAVACSWGELLRALGTVLRWVLGLSLLFELFVSLVLRRTLLPFFGQPGVDYESYDRIPDMLLWSRNELFEVLDGGRIQGIVGNANHLGFLALLAVIVFGIQLADRTVRRRWGAVWVGVAVLTLVLTRSATVTVAFVGVVAAALAVLVLRRARSPRRRQLAYGGIAAALAAGGTVAIVFREGILGLLGRSADLTGRFGIWDRVVELASERPAFGWGWVSFWMPWVEPFENLAFRSGVRQLQAHSTWLDVWLQLGIVGVVVFAALVVSALTRSWSLAVDRPHSAGRLAGPRTTLALLPLLVLVALLVQSVAESRLITEYGWVLLVLIAAKTKSPPERSLSGERSLSPSKGTDAQRPLSPSKGTDAQRPLSPSKGTDEQRSLSSSKGTKAGPEHSARPLRQAQGPEAEHSARPLRQAQGPETQGPRAQRPDSA